MKKADIIKTSPENIMEYINFQFDGIKSTLNLFGLQDTLSCIKITQDIFKEELKKRPSVN